MKAKKGKEKVRKDENFDEDQLIKLIKKNLKSKKKLEENCLNLTEDEKEEKVYNVTINNFIKPNINIVNNQSHVQEKKKTTKQRPQSAWKKEKDKINRTLSEKEGIKPHVVHSKDKSMKNMRRNGDQSPKKEKKYDRLMSTLGKGSGK